MGKTTEVAADRAFDQTKTVLPSEVAQGVYIQQAPSLKALKLMHMMIGTAGGRMADDVRHEFRLSDLKQIEGLQNHTRQTVVPLFEELRAATLTTDDPNAMRTVIGGFLDEAVVDYRHEISGDTLITWTFGSTFRRIARESNHWAILDRQSVFHLGSKYSVLLFQHISSLTNLKHVASKRFSVSELRAVLGVPEGKIERFANLKNDVLLPAMAEINSDLTRLTLTATYHKIGRTVAEVEIAWDVEKDLTKVNAELDRPKVGRKARRDGSAETPALAFPATGGTAYTEPWDTIRKENCNWDQAKVADSFRQFLAAKSIKLDAKNIETLFINFCAKLKKI